MNNALNIFWTLLYATCFVAIAMGGWMPSPKTVACAACVSLTLIYLEKIK